MLHPLSALGLRERISASEWTTAADEQKFGDHSKKMCEKVLQLIHEQVLSTGRLSRLRLTLVNSLSLKEDDTHERLDPAVCYLQKLSAECLDLIFHSAKWVLDINCDIACRCISLSMFFSLFNSNTLSPFH